MTGLIFGLILSSQFTTSDIVIQDEVYNRTHDYEHKIVWSSSNVHKLNRLRVVKIIDFENDIAWVVDEKGGRVIREDIYLAELESERKAKERYLESLRVEEKQVDAVDNRSYTVRFNVNEYIIDNSTIDEIKSIFKADDNISVIGFASPDGVDPKMRMELAYRRLQSVSQLLEENGFNVTYKLGVVCSSEVERSECWKVDITIDMGN